MRVTGFTAGACLAGASPLLAGCEPSHGPPPPLLAVDDLPVAGKLQDALDAGFTSCVRYTTEMRCRRRGVILMGLAEFNAAVDLKGSSGGGGFDQVILWHQLDQNAAIPVVAELERQGWKSCYTGEGIRGDQGIYTHPRSEVWLSMDLSYWGKRRLRLLPSWNNRERRC